MLERNPENAVPGSGRDLAHAYSGGFALAPHTIPHIGLRDQDDDEGFNPVDILAYIVRYRWLIATILAVGMAAAFAVTLMQTPKYRATVRLEIMSAGPKVLEELQVISEASDQRAFLTAAEKLKSRAIAQRAVFKLGLAQKDDFLFPRPDFSVFNLMTRAFGWAPQTRPTNLSAEERELLALNNVRASLAVEPVRNTALLAISYTSPSPVYARDIANEIAQSFIDQRLDQTDQTTGLAREFIQQQVSEVKARLETSERELVAYAKREGITLTGDNTSLLEKNIKDVNDGLSELLRARIELASKVELVRRGQAANLPEVLENEGIGKLSQQISELKGEYRQKLARFKPGFPEMVQLSAQIQEMERQLAGAVGAFGEGKVLELEQMVQREQDLKNQLASLERELAAFQDKRIEYTILKRDVDSNRAQYDSLIAKLNEIGVGAELRTQNAAVVDPALVPRFRASPSLTLNFGIGLVLASLIAALLVYILELMNNTFSSPDQIEQELKLPVLGILPQTETNKMGDMLADPTSALSEAYRSLRTSLQFTGTEGAPISMLVTSAEPSEGKSTTASRLAIEFGALGIRVLLIDADLRRPSQHRSFGTDNTIGLSNLLTSTVRKEDLGRIFRKTRYPNVTLVTAGTLPPNPADLLSSSKMALVLNACTSRYDMVIIDSPPVIGLSDVPILSRLVDATLLVVAARQSTRKSIGMALKRLRGVGASVVGAAMTKFAVDRLDYAYKYRYMAYNYHTYAEEDTQKLAAPETAWSEDAPDIDDANQDAAPPRSIRDRFRRFGDSLYNRVHGDS